MIDSELEKADSLLALRKKNLDLSPLARQRIAIVQNHQNKAGNHEESRQPTQSIGDAAFTRIHGLPICKQLAESKSRNQPGPMRIVVHTHPRKPEDKKYYHRGN